MNIQITPIKPISQQLIAHRLQNAAGAVDTTAAMQPQDYCISKLSVLIHLSSCYASRNLRNRILASFNHFYNCQ